MCLFDMCSRVVFFLWLSCVSNFFLRRLFVQMTCALASLREIPTCKKTNENERQNSFNCVSLLVCFHAFWMCFPFVVCSCVFSICVHVWCFFLWLSCVSNFFLRRLFVQMTCALASLCEIPTCKKTNENERQNSFNCASLLVCFHAFCMWFSLVCSCVFSICVHVWCFFLWLSCVSNFFLRRLFVQMTCALASLREIPTCKKTNENERQNSFNCVSLLVCFHAFWMCFPFVVCSCVFSIRVHVWCFFLWLSRVSNFFLRRLFVQMTCALASLREIPTCKKTNENERQNSFNCVSLCGVFSCLLDVFSLCCVFMCLFDMCSRVVFFLWLSCVSNFFLRRLFVQMTCALASLRKIPTCMKTNENERRNSFNCVSLLVCFHAFWMCFPFVVCSWVFSICVHVWCFFCDYHVCPISSCDVYLCRWHVLSPLCAKSPHVRKPMKMKDKILSIVFPFWCVFMPFGCVFPLLCVHVSFQYVFTCGVFFCDYHVCPPKPKSGQKLQKSISQYFFN